jgi:hypothetical protein
MSQNFDEQPGDEEALETVRDTIGELVERLCEGISADECSAISRELEALIRSVAVGYEPLRDQHSPLPSSRLMTTSPSSPSV